MSENPNWKPIETAPRDGTKIDLWVKLAKDLELRIPECQWNPSWGHWVSSKNEHYIHTPTHWMIPIDPYGKEIK